jgi:hypothetical protein
MYWRNMKFVIKLWCSRLSCLKRGHIRDMGVAPVEIFSKGKGKYTPIGHVYQCEKCGVDYSKFTLDFGFGRIMRATLSDLPPLTFNPLKKQHFDRLKKMFKGKYYASAKKRKSTREK